MTTSTADLVSTRLLQEGNRRAKEKSASESALAVRDKPNKRAKKGKAKPSDECHKCHGKGHWARDCPRSSREVQQTSLRSLDTREFGKVYATQNGSTRLSEILLDCAATCHMFFDKKLFTQYTAQAPRESVTVGDGKEIPVAGRGGVSVHCKLPNGIRKVVLHEVQYVPDLTVNLVSLGQLERKEASGSFGGGCIKVSMDGDELFRAQLMGVNLYRVTKLPMLQCPVGVYVYGIGEWDI
jgi:hypothetical protein